MLEFDVKPRDIVIIDENGKPLLAGDHNRRYFEAPWMHKYKGKLCVAKSKTKGLKGSNRF